MPKAQYVQCDEVVDYTPAADCAAGDVILQDGLVGVTSRDIKANTLGALVVEGVFDVQKDTSIFSSGQRVYWNPTGNSNAGTAGAGCATTTAGGKFMGRAVLSALTGDNTVRVMLLSSTVFNPLENTIADPGASAAIPVTDSGHVDLVSAAAETRTLAAPSYSGQQLSIGMKTDNGDIVVTCATGIDQTPHTTITFNDIGDHVLLVACAVGAALKWRLISNNGTTLG